MLNGLRILLDVHFLHAHFLEHVHFVAGGLFSHFAKHESPDLVVHYNGAIGVGLHIHDLIGLEFFDQGEHDLPHDLQYLKLVGRLNCILRSLIEIETMHMRVLCFSLVLLHDGVLTLLMDLDVLQVLHHLVHLAGDKLVLACLQELQLGVILVLAELYVCYFGQLPHK